MDSMILSKTMCSVCVDCKKKNNKNLISLLLTLEALCHCLSLLSPHFSALHHCDGQAETGDQGHGRGKSKKKVCNFYMDLKHLLNEILSIGPDPARPEGTDGNHEQNEQHAS